MADDEDPDVWMARTKRRGALRLLVLGGVMLIGGGVWAGLYWNHGVGTSPISYVRVVSVLVLAIGAGLAIAGAVGLAKR